MGCRATSGPPPATTGSSRCSISLRRSVSLTCGSMITEAAEARTSISALSRLVRSLSEVRPAAQNVPYSDPSERVTGTET